MLNRWRLAAKLLPLVAVVAGLKLVLGLMGWDPATLSPLYTGLVAGTIFLLGFLLAGTLADYKESEKLPGDLAASLEGICDECLILYEDKRPLAARDCLSHMQRLAASIETWLRNRERTDSVLEKISGLNRYFLAFEALTQPNFIVRLKQEQSAIRRMVIRINTIRETSFVMAGYAIAELTSLLLVLGLLFTDVGELGLEIFLVSTLAFLLGYMLLLIRDLDDPFNYEGRDQAGAAEVSLAPLEQVQARLASQAEEITETTADASVSA
jgi:branched-subunit amino acid transport protein AzlD